MSKSSPASKSVFRMTANGPDFLCSVLNRFKRADIALWVFGGWAEELWHVSTPRPHKDIDLLYPATSFHVLDAFIAIESAVSEIHAKHFSHKRALILDGVLFEFLLVQANKSSYITPFFDGLYRFEWPLDTFNYSMDVSNNKIMIASRDALNRYRQTHNAIEYAYTVWLQKYEAQQRHGGKK